MADKVSFTRPAAERIGKVVRIVESGDRVASPWSVGVKLESSQSAVRLCSWTSTWLYDQLALIRFASNTSVTATAKNVILNFGPGKGWVANNGTAGWHLVSADLTVQPGYDDGQVQLFGHSTSTNGSVAQWFSVAYCETTTE